MTHQSECDGAVQNDLHFGTLLKLQLDFWGEKGYGSKLVKK